MVPQLVVRPLHIVWFRPISAFLQMLLCLTSAPRQAIMEIDLDRIDEAVLALLFLGRHEEVRTWKSFDWATMERLHAKGFISDPVSKAKSVVFTEQGLLQSAALFHRLFDKRPV